MSAKNGEPVALERSRFPAERFPGLAGRHSEGRCTTIRGSGSGRCRTDDLDRGGHTRVVMWSGEDGGADPATAKPAEGLTEAQA